MRLAFACLALMMPLNAAAQSDFSPKTLEFEGNTWVGAAVDAHVEQHLGREALFLKTGRLWLEGAEFSDGVIEFDVTFADIQGFIGPAWRATTDDHFEELYFRSHLSGKPDAVQYTPVKNGLAAWQIFSDLNATAAADLKHNQWNRLKLVVQGDKADFYFNSEEPILHIPDLKTDLTTGRVGLRSSGPAGGEVRFSNITIRPLRTGENVVGTPKEPKPIPDGLITKWSVSKSFAEEDVAETLILSKKEMPKTWTELTVETNGIANLAKINPKTNDNDTVFVHMNINADAAQMKELTFGYSDRVRIYLNGKRVYYGNAGWRVRDYRFLGTVGFFDSVGLDLKKGDNQVMIAVSETFGGWAWAGAIADQNGITLSK